MSELPKHRHCEPPGPRKARPDDKLREAIQTLSTERVWIASSQELLAMTAEGGIFRRQPINVARSRMRHRSDEIKSSVDGGVPHLDESTGVGP
jgi:hypothetical protein